MSTKKVWTGATIWLDGLEIGSDVGEIEWGGEREALRSSTFDGAGWRQVEAGGRMAGPTVRGIYSDAAEPRTTIRNTLSGILAATPSRTVAAGDEAAFFEFIQTQLVSPAVVNQLADFELQTALDGVMAYAATVLDVQSGMTSSTTASAQELTAIATGSYGHACLIVTSIGTGTLDTVIESDTTGFPSATTRFTFAQVSSAPSAEIVRLAGPVTDTFWRADHTVAGASPDVDCVVLLLP